MSCRIEMDKECIELVKLLNTLYGIKTTESCCGHFKEPYAIYFDCTNFSSLGRLYRCIDRNYSDGKFVIEVCCSDTNPVYGFVLKSKKPFNNDDEMNESLNLLIENINYWFKDAFDEYFKKNSDE